MSSQKTMMVSSGGGGLPIFPAQPHAMDELVEKVIYTSAEFLFYILVCITLTHRQKVCISYTERGSQEQM